MKIKLIIATIGICSALTATAYAGDTGNSEGIGQLTNVAPAAQISAPAPGPAKAAATSVTERFREAVKAAYEGNPGICGLPYARPEELPAAAREQLERDYGNWGPEYPSYAYRMNVEGKAVYIVQNSNNEGMFMHIYTKDGAYIIGGRCNRFGDMYWNSGVNYSNDAPHPYSFL
jgi:hypothetical protein